MKTIFAAATLAAFAIATPAQDGNAQKDFQQRLQQVVSTVSAIDPATGLPIPLPELPKFNLDFPGGTPETA